MYCDYCKRYVNKTYTVELLNKDDYGRTGTVLSGICEECLNELHFDVNDKKLESLITEIGTLACHRDYVERYGE